MRLERLRSFLAWPYMLVSLLLLGLAAIFFFDLGGRSISSPDEGRYIQIPREMVESGDYVLPRLNGILYFEKPPLFYWMEAAVIKVAGISEFSMRIWPALLGLAGCLMAYGVARRFYGRAAGLVAAGVLATSLLYYLLSRLIVIDMAVSTFMCAALFAFLLSSEEEDERRAIWWARGGHAAAACAVLSKGLIGMALPGLIGLVWIAMIGRWSFMRRAFCPSGILIFFLIATPWHVLAALRNADFLWFYFVHEHWLRFTTTVHGRYQPVWYFVPITLAGFLPWTGYLWRAVKDALPSSWQERRTRPVELYLLLWPLIILVFFSLSDSKLPTYVLPVFPPIAVLIGRLLGPRIAALRTDELPLGRYVFVAAFGMMALLVAAAYLIPSVGDNELIDNHLGAVAPFAISIGVVMAVGVAAVFLFSRSRGISGTFAVIFCSAALAWSLISLVASRADPNSIKPLAQTIKEYRHDGEEVVSFGTFFYDLPVYLDEKILILDWTSEFVFGKTQEDTSRILLDPGSLQQKWNGPDRMFLIMRDRHFRRWEEQGLLRGMCVLQRTDRAVLLANRQVEKKDGKSACLDWHGFDKPSLKKNPFLL